MATPLDSYFLLRSKEEVNALHSRIKKTSQIVQASREPDVEEEQIDAVDVLQHFLKQDDAIRRAKMCLANASIAQDLPLEEKQDLQLELDHIKKALKHDSLKLTIIKAKTFSNYLAYIFRKVNRVLTSKKDLFTQEDAHKLRILFASENMKNIVKIFNLLNQNLLEHRKQLIDTHPEDVTEMSKIDSEAQTMLAQFEQLSLLYFQNLPLYLRLTKTKPIYEERAKILCMQAAQKLTTDPSIHQIFKQFFESKKFVIPLNIASLSIAFASTHKMMRSVQAIHMQGASNATLAAFALPATLYNVYKLLKCSTQSRELHKHIRQCKETLSVAKHLILQGNQLKEQAQMALRGNMDNKQAHILLARAEKQLSSGLYLKEITSSNLKDLQELREEMKANYSLTSASTFQMLGIGLFMGATTLQDLHVISMSAQTLSLFHGIGIAGGALGAVVGAGLTILNYKGLQKSKDQMQILSMQARKLHLMKSAAKEPISSFIDIEIRMLNYSYHKSQMQMKNFQISLASSICLTIAGVLALGVIIGSGPFAPALIIATIIFLSLIVLISSSHWFVNKRMKRSLEELKVDLTKAQLDKQTFEDKLHKLCDDLKSLNPKALACQELIDYLQIDPNMAQTFLSNPMAALQARYHQLL